MLKKLDWKFGVMLLAAIAGVAVPVWLWRADLSSRSLHFELVSQTPLQPIEPTTLPGLRLSVDGKDLEVPYLTVIKLTNDGARPIPSSDFEGELELRVKPPSSIARARITELEPQSLEPKLRVDEAAVRLSPLLLNPGDFITITVITAGSKPQFDPRARIAGIPDIPILDGTTKEWSPGQLAIMAGLALLYLTGATLMITFREEWDVSLRGRSAVLLFFLLLAPASIALNLVLEGIGVKGFWPLLLSVIVATIPASFISSILNRQSRTKQPPSEA